MTDSDVSIPEVYSRHGHTPIEPAIMVCFLHPNRSANERIIVWCEPHDAGYRLMRRDPCGTRRAERCVDQAAVYEASARWQAALTSAGWQPVAMSRTPPARRRASRTGHFHR